MCELGVRTMSLIRSHIETIFNALLLLAVAAAAAAADDRFQCRFLQNGFVGVTWKQRGLLSNARDNLWLVRVAFMSRGRSSRAGRSST